MARKQRDRGKERLWRRQVRQWQRSGLSIRVFCRQERLSEPSFYGWRRVLAERDRQRAKVKTKNSLGGADRGGRVGLFVPVHLLDEPAAAGVAPVEVVCRGGRVVRVSAGFEPAALREAVAVLEGLPCC